MPAAADPAPDNGASPWTVAICALIGLGLALTFFALRGPTYEAEALVAVSNPVGPLSDEVAVATSPLVLDAAAAALGFAPDVAVTSTEVAGLLTVTASDDDAQRAADAANAVAETYVQAQLGAAANVAQTAQAPSSTSGLGAPVFAAIGTGLGALVGAALSYVQSARRSETPRRLTASPRTSEPRPPTSDHQPALNPQPEPTAFRDPQPASPSPSAAVNAMNTGPSSFSDAASPAGDPTPPTWLNNPIQEELTELDALDRRSMQKQLETARYEIVLAHAEELAKQAADHERRTADLRAEVSNLNKQVRMQAVRLKNRSGADQTRAGDLEAQVDALEVELAALRQTLESERIAHTKRLTDERGAADRALDNARRQFREELAKHVHGHRAALAEQRVDLDNELAQARASHAAALEADHHDYERQLETERQRAEAKQAVADERHERDLDSLRATHKQALDRQAAQHKATIAALRDAGESSETHLRDVEKENRLLRVEVTSLQKQARHTEKDNEAHIQRLTEEVSLMKGELDAERQRNAALRADVLRRSAESHQAIDRAVEERTAQLAELEASVTRQRQYADTRVREISAAAEEQARQAATREASLTASISRLKRELEELKNAQTHS